MASAQDEPPDTLQLDAVQVLSELMQTRSDRVIGALSLVSPEAIRHQNELHPAEYLHRIPGVSLQQGTLTTSRLVIRGLGSRAPYATNRIRMYLGDIPVTDGNGETTMADLQSADIRYMEVLRGPSSAVFGPGLAGVIRLVPRWPEPDSSGIRLHTSIGSFGRVHASAEPWFSAGKWDMRAALSGLRMEGYRENSAVDMKNLSLLSRYRGERSTLFVLVQAADVTGEIPSSLNETDFLTQPRAAAPNWLAVNGFESYRRLRTGLSLHQHWLPWLFSKSVLFGSWYDLLESRPFNILEMNSLSAGFRQEFRADLPQLTIRTGVEARLENTQSATFVTQQGVQGDFLQSDRFEHREWNGFGLFRYVWQDRWSLEGGFNLGLSNHLPRPVLSPRLGLGYAGFSKTFVYLSVGHGFSVPTFEESLLADGRINPDIRPEQGWSTDLGIRGSVNGTRLSYDLALYHIRIKDLIVTRRLAEDQFFGVNAGQTRHSGLEAAVGWKVQWFEVQAGGYAGRFVFKEFEQDGQRFDGHVLPGVPSSSAHFRIDARPGKPADGWLEARVMGRQYLTDDNSLSYPAHFVVNAGISRAIFLGRLSLRMYLGVKNILDARYPSMVLVNAPAFGGSAPRYYYPAAARNFFIGLVADL